MKEKNPLVSVIVPVYNVRQYLNRCLDSILAQKYRNIEIIVVDDGSTDGSGEIAESYGKKYENVKIIHKENGGLSGARNTGMKYAHGDWFVFVDSDDYVSGDFVSTMLDLVLKNKADIATCSFVPFSDGGSKLKRTPFWPESILSGQEAINDMIKNKRPSYICLSMFNAELFKKNRITFPEGQDFEDIITRVRLLYNANKAVFTNDKLYFYLNRKDSITGKNISEKRCEDFLKAIDDTKSFLLNSKGVKTRYLAYFEYCSLMTLLNYLARERTLTIEQERIWVKVRRRLKKLCRETEFPTIEKKAYYKTALAATSNRKIYSMLYRRIKR